MIKKRDKCISCGSMLSKDIVVIGEQYPSAIFITEKDTNRDIESSSLNIARCLNENCGLVQLSSEYNLQKVFDNYPYESSLTATMKDILNDVVTDANKIVSLNKDDVVLDIGGNDGTLLSLISQNIKARINIDAAVGVNQLVTDSNYKYIHSKFNSKVYKSLDLPNPKLIFSIAMFYHLSNPLEFCKNVCDIMSDESVWVLQMTYLGTMLEDNIFDNIVHEHTAYYSLKSLEYLLSQVGLKVAEARIVKSYGGSLRVFIVKDTVNFPDNYWRKNYVDVEKFEEIHRTNTYEALYAFNSRVQLLCSSLKSIVKHIVSIQGDLWGFGASTKGNMLLQSLGITQKQMSRILDNSSKKIGKMTIGTKIPIVKESLFLSSLPLYLFILPYYYTDAFVKIIKNNLKNGQKVHLLIPLPYPYFITVTNGDIECKIN
jgi:NDP-4-keto-2,6-dideoxyhexose 3-C-methyltransferase